MYRIMPLPNRHFSKRCPTSDVSLPLTLGLIACLLLLAGAVHARLAAIWEPVPVARLFQNVGRYVKQHPNDARGHYTLGRIHSLVFSTATDTIQMIIKDWDTNKPLPLPYFPGYDSLQVSSPPRLQGLMRETRRHLIESLRQYRLAAQLAPKQGIYWLGLG